MVAVGLYWRWQHKLHLVYGGNSGVWNIHYTIVIAIVLYQVFNRVKNRPLVIGRKHIMSIIFIVSGHEYFGHLMGLNSKLV